MTFGHEPHLHCHWFNIAPSSLSQNCYSICCTAAVRSGPDPDAASAVGQFKCRGWRWKNRDSQRVLIAGFVIAFTLGLPHMASSIQHKSHPKCISSVFLFQCLKIVFKHGFSQSFLNGETTMVNSALVVSLGSPSCTSYKLSKSAIRIQCDFPQRDPAGICAACVASRLGQCIFSICHLWKKWKKKTRWNSPCGDEHRSDS